MTSNIFSIIKIIVFQLWKSYLIFHIFFTSSLRRKKTITPKIFYGGVRKGDIGGPLVKIKRLNKFFPEKKFFYNSVYLVSNSPYLNSLSLRKLKSKNIPIILNQNGVFFPGWYGAEWEKMNLIMSKAYLEADYVFWQSEFCKKSARKFLGLRKGPGEILYNAVDTSFFIPSFCNAERPFTFLIAGKINKHSAYRIDCCIEALRLLKDKGEDLNLNVAGVIDKNVLKKCLTKINKLDLKKNVKFLRSYNQKQAVKLYNDADCFVHMKHMDSCPNTVIEAMSCGLPILYSNSGGIPELVDYKSGVGISVENSWYERNLTPSSEDIAKGMIKIFKDKNSLGENARQRAVKNYDIKNWIKRHRYIFQKLLRGKK